MKEKLYWKVVRIDAEGRKVSCSADGKAQVVYKFNKWVTAPNWLAKKGYYIIVFNCRDEARWFRHIYFQKNIRHYSICKCKCQNQKPLQQKQNLHHLSKGIFSTIYDFWPTGSKSFEKVMLLPPDHKKKG